MVNQNKIFSFEIKRKAKNVFPSDVKRTVVSKLTTLDVTQIDWVGFKPQLKQISR